MEAERARAIRHGIFLARIDFEAAAHGALRAYPRQPKLERNKLESDYGATVDWRMRHLPWSSRGAYLRTARMVYRANTDRPLSRPSEAWL